MKQRLSTAYRFYLIDIGNTALTYATYAGGRLSPQKTIPHDRIPFFIRKCCKSGMKSKKSFIICSTVPKLSRLLINKLSKANGHKIALVGRDLIPIIRHKYRNINKLGNDRRLLIYGSLEIYRPPFLVLDFGTAITADFVSRNRTFEGGMIIPGPETAFQALIQKAALIPKTSRLPRLSHRFLGTSTQSCLESGILEAYGAMTEELIRRFKNKYGRNIRVLATGGFVQHLKPYLKGVDVFDPQLLLKSLLILYKQKAK